MTDYRVMCAELADAYVRGNNIAESIFRARTLLEQPVAEGPTDEELLELMPETMRDEFSYAAKVCSDATGGQVKPGIFRVALNTAALEYARAVLKAQ